MSKLPRQERKAKKELELLEAHEEEPHEDEEDSEEEVDSPPEEDLLPEVETEQVHPEEEADSEGETMPQKRPLQRREDPALELLEQVRRKKTQEHLP